MGVLNFHRIGINEEHIAEFELLENPERPGAYQWEALNDEQAAYLISQTDKLLEMKRFEEIKAQEEKIRNKFKRNLK